MVLGAGVNLSQDESEFPDEVQGIATSIGIERVADPSTPAGGVRIGAAEVLDAFLQAMERWLGRFETSGPTACLEELRRASLLIGRVVTIQPADGRPFFRGRVIDFGPGGELILERPGVGTEADRMTVVGGAVIAIEPPLRDAGNTD
jgi:biotin-(acetyl-CoA carboxylase) ligase